MMIEIVMQNCASLQSQTGIGHKAQEGAGCNIDKKMKTRSTMKVGFIGAGTVTATIGRHLINAGRTIVVSNSRGPETLGKFVAELGPGAIAGTKQQAAKCDIVILATKWMDVPEALKGVDWRGRILVDATNAHKGSKPDRSRASVARSRAALKGRTSSEIVAEMAAGVRLVKSISNMPMEWIRDFSPAKPRTVIFTSGDDAEAKQRDRVDQQHRTCRH